MPLALPRHNINFNAREYGIILKEAFRAPAHSVAVREFEEALESYLGVRHCIALSSGSAALFHGLMESGLRKGDAMIVPSYEFPSVMETVRLCGFVPVFAPVERETGNLSLRGIRAHCREGVRAVLAANIHGTPEPLPGEVGHGSPGVRSTDGNDAFAETGFRASQFVTSIGKSNFADSSFRSRR